MPGSYSPLWGPNVIAASAANMEASSSWVTGTQASAIARSNGTTDPACDGSFSVKITKGATNTGALCVNGTTDIPAAANTLYVVSCAFYTSKASVTFNLNLEQYTAAQAFISGTTTPTATAVQGSGSPLDNQFWTIYPPFTITTSGTTAFFRINPQMVSGLTTGDIVFMDSFFIGRLLEPVYSLPVLQAVNCAATR